MKKLFVAVLAVCMVFGCSRSQRDSSIRVMSYNIRIGIGMDDTIRLSRAADVIRSADPDFVGLQEVDSVAERSGWVDQAAELAELTGMHAIFAPALERSWGLYGIAALVKEKPLSYRNIALPGKEEERTFLLLEYEDYLLCNTHFSLVSESRKESIARIRSVLLEYDKPAIITGDFNMRPKSEECRMMGKAWTLLSDSTKLTFPADSARVTLDYIWGWKGHEYTVLENVVIDERMASDHLPIYVDVTIGK